MKITLIALVVAAIAFAGGVWYERQYGAVEPVPMPTNNEQNGGTPTTPPAKATYENADATKIVVDTPKPGATVSNTFTVSGKARGWYFEGSFPFEIRGSNNQILVQAPIQAQGDWMTAEFVPFTVQASVPANYKGAATLILRNDNPSGLPENAASISIPIVIQ